MREYFSLICGKTKTSKLSKKIIKIKSNYSQFSSKILQISIKFCKNTLKNSTTPLIYLSIFIPGCSFFILFLSILFILSHHNLSTKITAHVNALISKKFSRFSTCVSFCVYVFFSYSFDSPKKLCVMLYL